MTSACAPVTIHGRGLRVLQTCYFDFAPNPLRWAADACRVASVGDQPLRVRSLSATTRTAWSTLAVIIETDPPGLRGQFRVFNGELLARSPTSAATDEQAPNLSSTGWNEWTSASPLRLDIRYARPSFFKGVQTVLQFRVPGGGVGVGVSDLLTNGCVYVPSRQLFVGLADSPETDRNLLFGACGEGNAPMASGQRKSRSRAKWE
jgi:hypothetical protein